MKQRITAEDLMELTDDQKQILQGLWTPRRFDPVLANICINVENEEYRQVEFILGDVRVFGTSIYLWDYRVKIATGNDHENDSNDDDNGDHENANAKANKNTTSEDDNETDYSLESAITSESEETDGPEGSTDLFYYNKEECLPLLSIGQMMEMLYKNNYGDLYFYTTVGIGDEECGVGRDGNARDYESPELCDALWECLKEML